MPLSTKIPPFTTKVKWTSLPSGNRWAMETCWEASVAGFFLVVGRDYANADKWGGMVYNVQQQEYQEVFGGCDSLSHAEERAVLALVRIMSKIAHDATWQLIGTSVNIQSVVTRVESVFHDMDDQVRSVARLVRQANKEDAVPSSGVAPQARTTSGSVKSSPAYVICEYCGMRYKDHPAQGAGFVAICNKGKTAI